MQFALRVTILEYYFAKHSQGILGIKAYLVCTFCDTRIIPKIEYDFI
jgi:hypothetical protein